MSKKNTIMMMPGDGLPVNYYGPGFDFKSSTDKIVRKKYVMSNSESVQCNFFIF